MNLYGLHIESSIQYCKVKKIIIIKKFFKKKLTDNEIWQLLRKVEKYKPLKYYELLSLPEISLGIKGKEVIEFLLQTDPCPLASHQISALPCMFLCPQQQCFFPMCYIARPHTCLYWFFSFKTLPLPVHKSKKGTWGRRC